VVARLSVVVLALAAGACASSGAVPRPRPFPGATLPPAEAPPDPTVPPTPIAATPFDAVLTTAMELRGAPYRYGGSEPSGFDCSGFVQWVFAQHGTRLPREVKDQFHAGALIDRDEVQPGDLVFFQTVSRGASHVGIAIGHGEFVHAPSSRGVVRVEKYTSGYWDQRWVGARRVS
jgi:cell wall-associated NlpC family hydrolase